VLEAEATLKNLAGVFFPGDPLLLEVANQFLHNRQNPSVTRAELPDVEARYRTLVEQIPAVVFMAFLDKGIGEAYVSPQIEAMLGFTQEEWLNDPVRWYNQIHPEDKARWSAEAAQMFLSGEPLRSTYRVLARDSRIIWFHCEAKMVRADDGRPWFIHGVAFDITELKQAEETLKKNEEMLRGLFDYAPDTVVVVNHDGRIVRVNTQVEPMFGYTRDELISQPIEALIPERFRPAHFIHRAAYVVEPHTRTMGAGLELYGKRKDGSEFPVDIMLSPMEIDTGGMVIAVVRDITRRKEAESVVRNYAERLKFLSRRLMEVQEAERRHIARELHDEIGQVLTALKLTLELSVRVPPVESTASLHQAHALVNELMARARSLSLDLRPAMLDDLGLLPTLLWYIENFTARTRVRVNFKSSGLEGRRFAPEVETAAYRIAQEALTNVARHSEVDEATVRVWADDRTLTVQIEDQGKGFDLETVLSARDRSGLAGMRERAVLLGGQLLLNSRPGAGVRLTAELSVDDNLSSMLKLIPEL
jgi:PAS domain S-box-containing protein